MTTAELNEQSTTEEVQDYAEQVVKEVEADRAGEPKSDAQQAVSPSVSEHTDNEDTTVSRDEETPASDGETTGEDQQPDSWLDDDLKAEVSAYGIEESELADFTSREEVERALRLFDKQALAAGREALATEEAPEEKGPTRNEKGQFVKQESEKSEEAADGRFELKLDPETYDEELVGELTRMRDHYDSRVEALEERFHQAEAMAEEQHFDMLVDSLGHADLFGDTGKESKQQFERRQELLVALKAQQIGLQKLGRPVVFDKTLVNRVARMVFAEDLGKKELKSKTRKISKQSNGRQGGGATRASDPREDPRDEAERLYKEMEGSS